MSKFCGNCGAELDDSAAVCGYCGMSLETNPIKKAIPGLTSQADEAMVQNIKKYGKFVAIGVAGIVVIAIVISLIVNNTGYKGALKKYFNAMEDLDSATFCELTADLDKRYYDDDDDIEALMLENMEDQMEEFEEDYGKDVKIKYDIVESTVWDLDDVKLRKFTEQFEDSEEYDGSLIEKAVELELDITYKGDKKEHTDKGETLWLIKEGGEWRVTSYEF